MLTERVTIPSPTAMEALGAAIAATGAKDRTIYLAGDLAAGKTTLVRGYLRHRGHRGAVKSPTFTLVESYLFGAHWVHHFDLYRLADPEELEYVGIDEYFHRGADCLIEWPSRGRGVLPEPDLEIRLDVRARERDATLVSANPKGDEIIESVKNITFDSYS